MPTDTQSALKEKLVRLLASFNAGDFYAHSLALFDALGYRSDKTLRLADNHEFRSQFDRDNKLGKLARFDEWQSIHLLFQFTVDDAAARHSLFGQATLEKTNIESYLFFAIDLKPRSGSYSRTELAGITREVNALFAMPVLILFRCAGSFGSNSAATLTLAVIDRRLHRRDDSKDVLEKVTLIKDIRVQNPHRAHLEILHDLAFDTLNAKQGITSFEQLHAAWRRTLSLAELNKKFYRELSNWYFWAVSQISMPDIAAPAQTATEQAKSEFVIRLITRLVFTWFLKEKRLVPDALFDEVALAAVLNRTDIEPAEMKFRSGSTYYKAILQNLFFATLNQPMTERRFVTDQDYQGKSDGYLVTTLYRYARFFTSEAAALNLFKDIPFLNGGLFECLDKEEGKGVRREDWFSNNPANEKKLTVPDALFFGAEREVDLSRVYDDKKRAKEKVKGLFHILNAYKFTIAENTPVEEEIALDPELLGRIFENLLAAYNPETGTSARKATGSFYTPREIVDYMVDESLTAYLRNALSDLSPSLYYEARERSGKSDTQSDTQSASSLSSTPSLSSPSASPLPVGEDLGEGILRLLLSYDPRSAKELHLSDTQIETLIAAIDTLKILDPACGSGAFPMGVLQKLTHLLAKLDPKNHLWKEKQLAKLPAGKLQDDARQAFEHNSYDYARKLYLIRECIYGTDIQPVAIQIAKLRFFISLVIDQTPDDAKPNRNIESLPNLETKFVCANSLIGIARPDGLLIDPAVEQKESDLKAVREKFFAAKSRKEKKKLEEQDKTLREQLASLLKQSCFQKESAEQLSRWNPYDVMHTAPFFDSEWMFGIRTGFDIVIGNPPYIQLQTGGGKLAKQLEPQHFKTFSRTGDIYSLFYEKGFSVLASNGHLCFITSNKWMRANYGEKTRAFFAKETYPKFIIDFGNVQVFESATVDTNILLLQKAKSTSQTVAVRFGKDFSLDTDSLEIYTDRKKTLCTFTTESWVISGGLELDIKRKVGAQGIPLEKWDIDFTYGFRTGYNEAFIIDRETRDLLISKDKNNSTLLKPILRGKDISAWSPDFADLYLVLVKKGFQLQLKKDYPTIWQYLQQFEQQLKDRAQVKNGDHHWIELDNSPTDEYVACFEKPKIIYPNMTKYMPFVYDKDSFFINDKAFIITGNCLSYLTAFFNSRLFRFCFKDSFPELQGGTRELRKVFFEKIPVKKLKKSDEKWFEEKVEIIQKTKREGRLIHQIQTEIEEKMFNLYNLNNSEVQFIMSISDVYSIDKEEIVWNSKSEIL